MSATVYWIDGPWRGRLAIVPRPRGGDWIDDEVSEWRAAGIDILVSFLTSDEASELCLEKEKDTCEAHGIRFVSFPIPDRGVPRSDQSASELILDLQKALAERKIVALHCRQSIGRSALMAACLLIDTGEEPAKAFEQISLARGGNVPDTLEQKQWVADHDSADRRTKGERLFETYLRLQGITNYEFEKAHPGKSARPDYSVMLDKEYLFEVKDFQPTDILSFGAYDPYRRIRQKMDEARQKFKEFKGSPCCLVLRNNNAGLVHLETPEIIQGAMYGNFGWSSDFNPDLAEFDPTKARPEFLDGGKIIRPGWSNPQNTTISALITLRNVGVGARKFGALLDRRKKMHGITFRDYFSTETDFDKHERRLGVITWENAFASVPFPRDIFCGQYDERWGVQGKRLGRVFVGSEIIALEELEKSAALLQDAT